MWAVDESPAEKAKHERAVELLSVQPENLVVSTQVLQEFYVVTTSKLKNPLSEERAARAVRGIAKLDVVGVDATWVRALLQWARVRERAVPVVRVTRVVRVRAVRGARVTTSMWRRGGCSNVAVTSTWLRAAPAPARAGPVSPVRPVRYRGRASA